jgi:hypothetical protein
MAQPPPPGTSRRRGFVTKRISVPGNLRQACDEFNSGRFFECHETLEEIWQEEQGPVRDLYKGLIQAAAAFVHVTRGNAAGAERLLRTSAGYLAPYRAGGAMGFDVAAVCDALDAASAELLRAGPSAVETLYPRCQPEFRLDESRLPAESVCWAAWGFDTHGNALEMEITVPE